MAEFRALHKPLPFAQPAYVEIKGHVITIWTDDRASPARVCAALTRIGARLTNECWSRVSGGPGQRSFQIVRETIPGRPPVAYEDDDGDITLVVREELSVREMMEHLIPVVAAEANKGWLLRDQNTVAS